MLLSRCRKIEATSKDERHGFYSLSLSKEPATGRLFDAGNLEYSRLDAHLLRDLICFRLADSGDSQQSASSAALIFLLQHLDDLITDSGFPVHSIVMILTAQEGFAASSDFLATRLIDCEYVDGVVDFVTPGERLQPAVFHALNHQTLLDALQASIGGFVVSTQSRPTIKALNKVHLELENRLTSQWIIGSPVPRRRLALVEGRPNRTTGGWVYEAANNLGIDLIVMDRQGHWIQDEENAHLREIFMAIDMTRNVNLPFRIVEALKSIDAPIHGIATFSDHYVVSVAEAAQLLELPHSSPSAFRTSINKYESRMLQPGNCQVFRAPTVDKLRIIMHSCPALRYPVVVKPTQGYGSEGVAKVNNDADLWEAATKIDTFRHGSDILVETYVDGPEVDANFVLYNGQVLFSEISDDLPCKADSESASASDNFLELAVIMPTKLDPCEVSMIKEKLHKTLLRMGFRAGVFHVEARVRNSRMQYQVQNGEFDLQHKPHDSLSVEPSVFLLEVNPRCPGFVGTSASTRTYGVNYYALHLLLAVEDTPRLLALSQPFAKGAQYWSEITLIPVPCGGIFNSEDPCRELQDRCPKLAANISMCVCFYQKDDIVPDPSTGVLTWVALFLVYSRTSRSDVIQKSEEIRRQFRYAII